MAIVVEETQQKQAPAGSVEGTQVVLSETLKNGFEKLKRDIMQLRKMAGDYKSSKEKQNDTQPEPQA